MPPDDPRRTIVPSVAVSVDGDLERPWPEVLFHYLAEIGERRQLFLKPNNRLLGGRCFSFPGPRPALVAPERC